MSFFRKLFRGNEDPPAGSTAKETGEEESPGSAEEGQTMKSAEQPQSPEQTESTLPKEPAPGAETALPEEPAPGAEAAEWWASSAPASEAAPPASQSAIVAHSEPEQPSEVTGAPASGEGDTPILEIHADSMETPTAPMSMLKIEQARERLAEEEARLAEEEARLTAEAPTPPAGMPVAEAAEAPTPPAGTPVAETAEAPTLSAGTPVAETAEAAEAVEGTRKLDDTSAPALSPQRSVQGLAAMASRDVGRVREINQDSVFTMLTTLPRESSDLPVGLFIVADGMGGHQGGEVASRLAVRTVVHQVLSQLVLPALNDSFTEALQPLMISAVQAANEAIWEQSQAIGSDMGTTCTAVLMVGHSLYIAHVGDTRAYLYEPGGLRQLTNDHSTVGRLIQLGHLEPTEAREHPLRNQLYRTIGQQPQVQVDFVYQPIGLGTHVLMCSDGLWGMIDERMMERALQRSPWPQDICNELIALANLAGGEDNISAVVVSLPLAER